MSKTKMMKCPVCSGTGIQEQTMKGYRRYKCWCCDGAKEVEHPFPDIGTEQIEQETEEQETENE